MSDRRALGDWSRRVLVLVSGLFLPEVCVWGWWDAGHRIVACIAWQELSVAERAQLVGWLQGHPRWESDFRQAAPDAVRADPELFAEWAWSQAAVWPDTTSRFRPVDRERYHRPEWHYINRPMFMRDEDRVALQPEKTLLLDLTPPDQSQRRMNVVQVIRWSDQRLSDRSCPDSERGLMLCWLLHTVGDLHQPLHSTALFSQRLFPNGCRGGNLIPTRPRENLHALWDSLLGEKIQINTARQRAARLRLDDTLQAEARAASAQRDPVLWMHESHQLVRAVVYTEEILTPLKRWETRGETPQPIELSEEYLRQAGNVARMQVLKAGYRLADMLRRYLRAS